MGIEKEILAELPKTDLHCHLDGSIRAKTLIDLAKKYKKSLPSYEKNGLIEAMGYGTVRKSLEDYLRGFEPIIAVMQDQESIYRVFYELCEDAHRENVWHLEVRYCPLLHIKQGLTSREVIKVAIKAGDKAKQDFGISVGHILCGLKNDPDSNILEIAKLATEFVDQGVVGFDLAGPEAGFPLADHLAAIYYARKHHLFITLHAGESYGPASIAQAIHKAGAHRVGHGTSLIKDPDLLNYVIDHRIGVEACPISNWHTGAVKTLADHPIKKLLDLGVRVSVNTDNRLVSNTSITDELFSLIENLDFTENQIHRVLENGFKSAFLPYNSRSEMISRFHNKWNEIMKS